MTTTNTIADKFDEVADSLQAKIDEKTRPLTHGWTPKRGCEYSSRCHDGENLRRAQAAMRALAAAHRAGTVPAILSAMKPRTSVILQMVRTKNGSNGYYDHHDTHEPADQCDMAKALRALVESSKDDEAKAADAERVAKQNLERAITALRGQAIEGFYPSPPAVIEQLLNLADLHDGLKILEPSAGIGSIADAIMEKCKPSQMALCELRYSLIDILAMKGYDVYRGDFLEATFTTPFDRIVMNPPFERRQAWRHVEHAYQMLAPGGILVSVVPGGAIPADTQAWLATVNYDSFPLPSKAFDTIDTFNRTGVNCQLVRIVK
jgi:phospholipid N-methyltransferase